MQAQLPAHRGNLIPTIRGFGAKENHHTNVRQAMVMVQKISRMPFGHITDSVLQTEGLPLGDVGRASLRRLLMYCHTNPDTKAKKDKKP